MNCRDCISSEVCYKYQNMITGIKTYDEYFDKDVTCEYFKDKSKIMELPYKQLSTIYYISDNRVFVGWYLNPFNSDYHIVITDKVEISLKLVASDCLFENIEEAKQALRESETNA